MSKRTFTEVMAMQQLSRNWLFDHKHQRDVLWGMLLAFTGVGAFEDEDLGLLISIYFERCSMELGVLQEKPIQISCDERNVIHSLHDAIASTKPSFIRLDPKDFVELAG